MYNRLIMVADDSKHNRKKIILLIFLPWILILPPFSAIEMCVVIFGTLVAGLIMGFGLENLALGLVGGFVSLSIFVLLVPLCAVVFTYKEIPAKKLIPISLGYLIYLACVHLFPLLLFELY